MTRPTDAEILVQLKAYHAALDVLMAMYMESTRPGQPRPQMFMPTQWRHWPAVRDGNALIQRLEATA